MTDVDLVQLAGHRGRLARAPHRRPGDRRGHPRRDGDRLLRDGDVRLAHRHDAHPQPEQRAQRHDPRRPGPAGRAVGRHPAVHAHRRRCRCASRSSSSAPTSSARATSSSANDPYHGGGHLPDYNVFAPVFGDDPATGERRMVLIASIQCHHGDTGGGVPGGYNVTANDIWGEGVRWPVGQGHRPGRRAARRALRAAGQQPPARLHRRPARPDRRRAAGRRAAGRHASTATAPTPSRSRSTT